MKDLFSRCQHIEERVVESGDNEVWARHTVGLTWSMVGILADYDNSDTAEWGEVRPCVYVLSCWVSRLV